MIARDRLRSQFFLCHFQVYIFSMWLPLDSIFPLFFCLLICLQTIMVSGAYAWDTWPSMCSGISPPYFCLSETIEQIKRKEYIGFPLSRMQAINESFVLELNSVCCDSGKNISSISNRVQLEIWGRYSEKQGSDAKLNQPSDSFKGCDAFSTKKKITQIPCSFQFNFQNSSL